MSLFAEMTNRDSVSDKNVLSWGSDSFIGRVLCIKFQDLTGDLIFIRFAIFYWLVIIKWTYIYLILF